MTKERICRFARECTSPTLCRVMGGCRREAERAASVAEDEALLDDLVGDVVGSLAMLREPCYGGVLVTDDQIKERARAIVQLLVLNYRIERLPETAENHARRVIS